MKMRYYVIGFHVVIGIIFAVAFVQLNQLQYTAVDIAKCNGLMKNVSEALDQTKPETIEREQVCADMEKQYGCKILFTADLKYLDQLYASYRNGDVIFDYGDQTKLEGKIIFYREDTSFHAARRQMQQLVFCVLLLVLVLEDVVFFLLYRRIYAPFWKLQQFAAHIAAGNLELPLDMNEHNYFGAFTESFDIMREELKAAREGEARASRSKKELVAGLSHDIKTPVATIKALCEILEIQEQEETKAKKIRTIGQKADQIDQLISNMFHATLSELEMLRIHLEAEPSVIIKTMLEDMNHYELIRFDNEVPSCLVVCDRLRLTQVLDNIIGNSYKYAGTKIYVRFWEEEQYLFVQIRDEGMNLEELDAALVCEKFYRGSNAEKKNGSGLGLFLAKTFMEGMGGSLACTIDRGFVVTLVLKKEGKTI